MYTSSPGLFGVDQDFVNEVEPLLVANKVSLFLFLFLLWGLHIIGFVIVAELETG